jgi:hypothetical protein
MRELYVWGKEFEKGELQILLAGMSFCEVRKTFLKYNNGGAA